MRVKPSTHRPAFPPGARPVDMEAQSDSRSMPTSTARRTLSSSQSITKLGATPAVMILIGLLFLPSIALYAWGFTRPRAPTHVMAS